MKLCGVVTVLVCCSLPLTGARSLAQTAAAPQTVAAPPAPATDTKPLPKTDPTEFMRAAADANSLTGADMKPWHVKAKYQGFGEDGEVEQEGTFEMWWAGPEKYKTTYVTDQFSRVVYRAGKDNYFTGSEMVSGAEGLVRNVLTNPLPEKGTFKDASFTEKDLIQGGVTLQCYFETGRSAEYKSVQVVTVNNGKGTTQYKLANGYCFSGTLPAVRIIGGIHPTLPIVGSQQLFNSIVRLHGHYVARSIVWNRSGKPWQKVSVDLVEPTLGIQAADLEPPPDAKIVQLTTMFVDMGVMSRRIVSKQPPQYPEAARAAHIEGTVVLGSFVDETGKVTESMVESGPDALGQAALDAVKNWRYKPYLLDGKPFGVHTQIEVVFKLGHF